MPLAVELAATWVRLMEVDAIAQQIRQDIDFLATSLRDLPPRQRSMRVVFEQMWGALAAGEQQTLAALSVFRGPFRLSAATAVTAASPLVLATLLDKSLLRQAGGSGRFELHELLRQFAAEKLEQLAGGAAAHHARDQHSAYFLEYTGRHGRELNGQDPKGALASLQRNLDNIRLAWRWAAANGKLERLEAAASALADFYRAAGLLHEGVETFATAAAGLNGQIEMGLLDASVGRTAVYQLQQHEARLLSLQGTFDRALAVLESLRAGWEVLNNRPQLCRTLNEMGYIHMQQRHAEEARHYFDQSLSLARELGDERQVAFALHHKGNTFWHSGEFTIARDLLSESISLYRGMNDPRGLAGALNDMAITYLLEDGKNDTARMMLIESLSLFESLHDHYGQALAAANLGSALLNAGDIDNAQRYSEQALRIAQEAGLKGLLQYILGNLGHATFARGNLLEARPYYQESLKLAQETGEWDNGLEALSGMANVAARSGEEQTAARWLGTIAYCRLHVFQAEEAYVLAWEQETIARLRAALGEEMVEQRWAEGQGVALEAAAAEALAFAGRTVYSI
jgi:tetratricopeptide (TPR) repeat protein